MFFADFLSAIASLIICYSFVIFNYSWALWLWNLDGDPVWLLPFDYNKDVFEIGLKAVARIMEGST